MQTEKQDHDATKNFIKKLKEQNDELLDKIRVDKKRYDQLQDDVERFVTLLKQSINNSGKIKQLI